MMATAGAMKLAGTTSDAMAIRAKLDAAIKALARSAEPGQLRRH